MSWGYRASSYANDGAGWLNHSNGSTEQVTLGTALTSGDCIILSVFALDTSVAPTFSGITDTVNGSWSSTPDKTQTFTVAGLLCRHSVYSFPNSGAGTPTISVTVNITSGTTHNGGMSCVAYSGLATSSALDVAAAGTGTASPATSGATSATGGANELVVGAYIDAGDGLTLTADGTCTQRGKHDADTHAWESMMEDKDSGTAGSTPTCTVTMSAASAGYSMMTLVYKLPGGGGGGTVLTPMRTLRGAGV